MKDAMDLVRNELGIDAVVVDSKEIDQKRFLPWPSVKREIEVRAERLDSVSDDNVPALSRGISESKRRTVRTLAENRLAETTGSPRLSTFTEDLSSSASVMNSPLLTQPLAPLNHDIEHRSASESSFSSAPESKSVSNSCHTIVVAGGKGGVGRSVIALNLAVALSQRGDRVGLIDASPGCGNIAMLSATEGYWNLGHVLQGCRQLDDVVSTGPAGIKVLSGAACVATRNTNDETMDNRVFEQITAFERGLDWLVVDASGGASSLSRPFVEAADDVLIVTVPEATALTDAYASVKSFALFQGPRMGLLVNQSESADLASRILDRLQHAAHSFLQVDLHRRGYLTRDSAVAASVNTRHPFVLQSPTSPASLAMKQLAQHWTRFERSTSAGGFFSRLRQVRETSSKLLHGT
jgi:flagellar biosynthesis protein FlhG